ncbi:MAG: hypothetical protein LBQ15_10850 [Clostridium sp.]|nr:hypothetical protein [Clostridium sp.]
MCGITPPLPPKVKSLTPAKRGEMSCHGGWIGRYSVDAAQADSGHVGTR